VVNWTAATLVPIVSMANTTRPTRISVKCTRSVATTPTGLRVHAGGGPPVLAERLSRAHRLFVVRDRAGATTDDQPSLPSRHAQCPPPAR
jgi:hypothetical protein